MNTGFKDKNGIEIPDHSIVYGNVEDKFHFFSVYLKSDLKIQMIACTYGYLHNVTQNDIKDFLLIGSIKEHKHLLECD